jgi:hypothetical protein
MDLSEKKISQLRYLRSAFEHSEVICDPIEYIQRKKDLLNILIKLLLIPLEEYEEYEEELRKNHKEIE